MKRYVVQRDYTPTGLKAGEVVYDYTGCTYGLTSDDTRSSGREHTAVCRNAEGQPPFVTVPMDCLQEVAWEAPDA